MIKIVNIRLYKIRVFKNKKYKKQYEKIFHKKKMFSCESYILKRF